MSGELVYEIARYSEDGEKELLTEQIFREEGQLWRFFDSEQKATTRGIDVTTLIRDDPVLSEIRPGEVTRIKAEPSVLAELPFLLHVTGEFAAVGDDLWHSSEHLLETSPDVEVYVNDSPWDVFRTNDGERLLPFDEDREWIPLLSKCWGELRFIEEASMTAGFDECTIGLATDRIVLCANRWDAEGDSEIAVARRGDDASMFVEWLLDDSLVDHLVGDDRQKFWPLLTRLFVEATRNNMNGTAIAGDRLVEGFDPQLYEFGTTETSRWTLALDLELAESKAIFKKLSERGGLVARRVGAETP
jgi:hypothetical protein